MGIHERGFSLLLVAILTVSIFAVVESVSAQAIPKPSVPEYTLKFIDRSYVVEESSIINQFTGKTEVIPAHRVQNYTVELTIKNQLIASSNAEFRYDINVKGHFSQNWTIMYLSFEGPKMSSADYTTITYELASSPTHPEQGFELRSFFDDPVGSNTISGIPPNSQLDFRVRAMYGSMHRIYNPNATDQLSMYPWVFEGETSDWSYTQSITIGEASISISPSPSVPELPFIVILLIMTLTLAVSVFKRKIH